MLLNALRRLSAMLDAIAEWTGKIVSWLVLLMVLLGAYNALARWGGRYIGADLSSNGLLEAQWYIFSMVFLLCASFTLMRGEHVRVDVLFGRLSPRGKAWVDLLGSLFLLLPFCAFALIYAWPGVAESFELREQSPDPGGLPRYPLKAVLLVAFGLLTLQGVSELVKSALVLAGDAPKPKARTDGAESEKTTPDSEGDA